MSPEQDETFLTSVALPNIQFSRPHSPCSSITSSQEDMDIGLWVNPTPSPSTLLDAPLPKDLPLLVRLLHQAVSAPVYSWRPSQRRYAHATISSKNKVIQSSDSSTSNKSQQYLRRKASENIERNVDGDNVPTKASSIASIDEFLRPHLNSNWSMEFLNEDYLNAVSETKKEAYLKKKKIQEEVGMDAVRVRLTKVNYLLHLLQEDIARIAEEEAKRKKEREQLHSNRSF